MRISRLQLQNFRNFRDLDIALGEHVVIVGENGVGKSNLIQALRLVLDPALPDTHRALREEDFWDGLPRPLADDSELRISVEFADFEDNDAQLASLAEFLVSAEPMVARLTYVARPATGDRARSRSFDFHIFGGDREENVVPYDVRRRLPVDYFHALRDVESDLANWRRSPLRSMLERAWTAVGQETKDALKENIEAAAGELSEVESIAELTGDINETLSLIGGPQAVHEVQLGVAPTDIDRLLRTLRLLFDDGRRGIGDTSLGLGERPLLHAQASRSTAAGDRGRSGTIHFLLSRNPKPTFTPTCSDKSSAPSCASVLIFPQRPRCAIDRSLRQQ